MSRQSSLQTMHGFSCIVISSPSSQGREVSVCQGAGGNFGSVGTAADDDSASANDFAAVAVKADPAGGGGKRPHSGLVLAAAGSAHNAIVKDNN